MLVQLAHLFSVGLLDDLNNNVKYWHELAGRLSGFPVSFLIASREENWFRYSGNIHNLQWASVFPQLNLKEARDIFKQFKNGNRIASNITSAEWAYEQVSDKKLLIEYVFLITQGQMLSERLTEQVKTIHFNREDPAKLKILRLVSLGQTLDIRLTLKNLISAIAFNQDADMVFRSMAGEYIELTSDGYIEGLHFVRSEHLVSLLHTIVPLEDTLAVLIDSVSSEELPVLALNMFSMLEVNDVTLINKLVIRTNHDLEAILDTVRNIFRADEYKYLLHNREIVDKFIAEFGISAFRTFFANANKPVATEFDVYEAVKRIQNSDTTKIDGMKALTDKMPDRDYNGSWSKKYLELAIQNLSPDDILMNLSASAVLTQWVDFFKLQFHAFHAFTGDENWHEEVLIHPIEEVADFLFAVWRRNQTAYLEFISTSGEQIRLLYKSQTNTIWIEEREGQDLYIEFIVDEEQPIHSQAMTRIEIIWRLYPNFGKYSSQGLYPKTDIKRLEPDESVKSLTHSVREERIPAEVNRQYVAMLEQLYNANPILFDWVAKWQTWRAEVLEFLQEVTKRHEKLALGKRYKGDILVKSWEAIRSNVHNPPNLPTKFKILLAQEEKAIKDWHKSVSNFLSNYWSNLSLADEHKKRLTVFNLKEAIYHLNGMQTAFSQIRRGELSYFTGTLTAKDESDTYDYLWNLLQYTSSQNVNYTRNKRVPLKTVVSKWVEAKHQEFVDTLTQGFQSIFDYGRTVYLPSDYLYEGVLKSVCFAVEVTGINPIRDQLSPALVGITQTQIEYDFIYIIPVINQQRLFSFCYRASRRIVDQIDNGTYTGEKIGIFPLVVPQMAFELIPELSEEMLIEGKFILEALQLLGNLDALRNEVYFIHSKLSINEKEFRDSLLDDIRTRLKTFSNMTAEVVSQARQVSSVNASSEWLAIVNYIVQSSNERINKAFSIKDYTPVAPIDDTHLTLLFDKYVKAEYL